MRHVPHVHLAGDAVRADDFEEFPILLVAITPVEVDERVRGAQSHDFVFLVEGHGEDVRWSQQGQVNFLTHTSRGCSVVLEPRDRLVRHGCDKLDALCIGLQRDKRVRAVVKRRLNYWTVPDQSVLKSLTQVELLENLRPSHLQHVVLVQVVWLRGFVFEDVLSNGVLADDLIAGECASHRKLFLIDSLDKEASELVPLHETVAVDVNLLEQLGQADDQVCLLGGVLVWNDAAHQVDKLKQREAILFDLLLGEELASQHLQLVRVNHLHNVVNGELVHLLEIPRLDGVFDLTELNNAHLLGLVQHRCQDPGSNFLDHQIC